MKNTNGYNFIKQAGIYVGAAALFLVLALGAKLVNWNLGSADQMFILVNLVMALGFLGYLSMSDYRFNRVVKITDKKALYWVCFAITLSEISSFYRPDLGWNNNASLNIWILIETLLIAAADEIVFRAFGDWCFPVKGVREEAVMIIYYTAFYAYCFADETGAGIMAMVFALGIGFLFTGLYLRFRKIGANILFHFLLIYLSRVTEINSSEAEPILGDASTIVFALGIICMIWYGTRLIGVYNREGVYVDAADAEDGFNFAKTFTESRDKYREKVITKAQPSIDKSNERARKKIEARAAKQEAKKKEKEAKK